MAEVPSLWSKVRLRMDDVNHRGILKSDIVKVVDSLRLSFFDASKARGLIRMFRDIILEPPTPLRVVRILLNEIKEVKDLHLRTLTLKAFRHDHQIDPSLFTGLVRLKTCSIHDLCQLEPLLQAIIASNNINLKSLELDGCSMSGVSPGLFQAVTKLEEFKLVGCILPSECLTAMLEASREAGKFKKLIILGNDVDRTGVEPEPVESIVKTMEERRLWLPGSTPLLCAIFEVRSDGPKCLYLSYDDY